MSGQGYEPRSPDIVILAPAPGSRSWLNCLWLIKIWLKI